MPERSPWRLGRKVGRTIYRQVGPEPSDDDVLIGMMDTPDLAWQAVAAHNFRIGIGAALWHTFVDDDEDELTPVTLVPLDEGAGK